MNPTRARIDWPTVMLVAFGPAEAKVFQRVLDAQMFKVAHADTVAAATEQLPTTMPHVVAVAQSAVGVTDAAFAERATAIGAEVLVLAIDADPKAAEKLLCAAVDRALARRAG